jgi:phenylpropionate dioxygenase-like ring-hydroxylating dioxygenase large terminal subunit
LAKVSPVNDIIRLDTAEHGFLPQDVPFAITDPLRIPRERYYDRVFFEREKEKLWMRTWQMACRLEEIPNPNDFTEYEICDQSILLVRQQDMSVRALFNACRHRGTQLKKGAGTLVGGKIVCPFHGWRWKGDGATDRIYGASGFAPECLVEEDVRLQECRVELWGGCAWVNFDPDAGQLTAALSPAAAKLEEIGFGNLRVKWWKELVLNANWKIVLEAFLEGWHVMQTHPQLTRGHGEDFPPDTGEYLVYDNGHSSFQLRDTTSNFPLDALIAANSNLAKGQDAMALDRDIHVLEALRNRLQPGDHVRDAVKLAFREFYKASGIPMVDGVEHLANWWGGEIFLFPNFIILPMYGNALCYRARPHADDPEQCLFEVWSLTTYPESHPVQRASLKGRFDKSDSNAWGLIPRQDFSNIERQQRGLHTMGYNGHRLAVEWENAIGNMHMELDRRMARP